MNLIDAAHIKTAGLGKKPAGKSAMRPMKATRETAAVTVKKVRSEREKRGALYGKDA